MTGGLCLCSQVFAPTGYCPPSPEPTSVTGPCTTPPWPRRPPPPAGQRSEWTGPTTGAAEGVLQGVRGGSGRLGSRHHEYRDSYRWGQAWLAGGSRGVWCGGIAEALAVERSESEDVSQEAVGQRCCAYPCGLWFWELSESPAHPGSTLQPPPPNSFRACPLGDTAVLSTSISVPIR